MNDYKIGEYVVYQNDDEYEIGRVKKLKEDIALVCFNEGEKAAAVPYERLHRLLNRYVIRDTAIGGTIFK